MSYNDILLVGDNSFHGISHLSQERIKSRAITIIDPQYAAKLVTLAIENGANGFMFSVSETTISILKSIKDEDIQNSFNLYAIVPYAYEYVRLATSKGGIVGLAKEIAKQVILSRNLKSIYYGILGVIGLDPTRLMKAYLSFEVGKINSSIIKKIELSSILLHEVITDIALALNLEWVFRTHIDFMRKQGIKPGFETRNFAYLINKFQQWGIDTAGIVFAASFNAIGFQMCPTQAACENALEKTSDAEILAFSILAAGRLKMPEAIKYISQLNKLNGVAVGISREEHSINTFSLLKKEE